MNSNKKTIIVMAIMFSLLVIGGTTYAWLTWRSSQNTELTLRIGEIAEIKFFTGNDISTDKFAPVLDYNDGEITTFSIKNKGVSEGLKTEVILNITSIDDELKTSSFKYVLLESSDDETFNEVASGSFENINIGNNKIYETDTASGMTYYKVILYIDGNMENNINMMNKAVVGIINVNVNKPMSINDMINTLAIDPTSWENDTTWQCGDEMVSGLYGTNSYEDPVTGETKYHEYRYIGNDVNNFVWFNNDMYRIIGIFDGYSHGVGVTYDENDNTVVTSYGDYLIKLIMADTLISSSWGVYNTSNNSGTYSDYANDWTGTTKGVKANLNVLLNEYFLNKTDTSEDYGACSNWTYYSSNNNNYKTNDCSKIVGYGIDNTYRNYIENVTWHLKGFNSNSYTKDDFYKCERGITIDNGTKDSNCNSGNNGAYAATANEKIGLMYASDYAYASGYCKITATTTLGSSYCGNKNWLYNGYEWTITPRSDNATHAFFVYSPGSMDNSYTSYGFASRPSFYLKSNIQIRSGEGTISNPYLIG